MGRFLFVLLLFYFRVNSSLSTSLSSSLNSAPSCLPQESSALLQFKSTLSLDYDESSYYHCATAYPKTNSWSETSNCCLWEGVTCDNVTAHVIALDLSCSLLMGSLSASSSLFLLQRLQQLNLASNYFKGLVPSEISLLSQLVSVDLSQNAFTIDEYSYDKLARNLTRLTNLFLDSVNMSCVPPSSLLNFTSSLKRLSLASCELQGELPTEVFQFQYLQYLDLSFNYQLTGLLPKSNWSSPLELLDLSGCNFRGPLPASLGNLTQIVSLYLFPNSFEGKIPDVFGSLKKLGGDLDLRQFNFSGPLPLTAFNLTHVTSLDLACNSLEGELPAHVTGLQNLEFLFLDKNLISGAVPSWLFALPSLRFFDLSYNKLLTLPTDGQILKPNSVQRIYLGSNEIRGSIPSFFFDLVNLTFLDLSSNNLSGVITSEMLSKCRRLQTLSLSNNNLLSLTSSTDIDFNYTFHELDFSYCNIKRFPSFLKTGKKLRTLDLSNNKIEGSIAKRESEGWEQLTHLNLSYNSLTSLEQYPGQNLESFDASSNQLRGPLLAPPASLRQFLISNNNLTGEIPTLICNLSSLQNLDLSMNKLVGIIPACLGNSSEFLSDINLQMNKFRGQIPAFDGNGLLTLALNDNQLQRLLPRSLVSCSALRFLNVANNQLNDTFPHWLGILPELQVLMLRANRFHGPLKNAIAPSSFSSLEIIDLSQNMFTGALPTNFLKDLRAMKFQKTQCVNVGFLYVEPCIHENRKSLKVMIKRLQMELQLDISAFLGFKIIDFSNNQFYGHIPDVLGELGSLDVLNLSYNQLTGSIPPLLGHMKELESLDLSSNKLSGRIPLELTNLTFLEVLNLSQNNLVGPIPQGKQFDTFENDSYSGNPGLWGCPLSKKCRSIPEPPPSSIVDQDDDDDHSRIPFIWKVTVMGYGCGVVLGLSMGYIVFTTGRPRWIVRKIERDWQKNVTSWIRRIRGRRNWLTIP